MRPDPIPVQHEAAKLAQQRWGELKSERANHEQMWEGIARLMRPQRGGFGLDNPAGRELERPLSSAPIHAHSNFAAGLYGTMTNPANRWFGFRTDDEDVNNWHPMRQWLDLASRRVLASFLPASSTFYTAATQVFSDLAAFGNSAQYDEVILEEKKILDITISLAEVVFDIDGFGAVCEVVRKFHLKPAAAMRMFAKRGHLPERVAELAQKGSNEKITFFQHVIPNDGYWPGSIGLRGKKWVSRYCCEVENTLVRESGYDDMPFFAPRWEVDSGQVYGIGPGFVALASARAHNRMDEATLRAAQRAADPTILAPDRSDFPLNGRVRPGSVVYGAVDGRGNQLVRALELGGGIGLTLEEKQAKLQEIRDAFHYTLLQLAGRTGMTATEVMAITEERQRLWAPHQGRVQEEYLAPKIGRRFGQLWRSGQLPPPPNGLPEGLTLDVSYESAAAAAQKSVEGNAAIRVVGDLTALGQISQAHAERVSDRIDPDGFFEVLAEARGAPARMIRSREDADKIAAARAEQAQMAQAMQAGQAGAGIMKDLSQAGMLDPMAEGMAQ